MDKIATLTLGLDVIHNPSGAQHNIYGSIRLCNGVDRLFNGIIVSDVLRAFVRGAVSPSKIETTARF